MALALVSVWPGVAGAVEPPVIDPGALPPDTTGPEMPMEQRQPCMEAFAKEGSQFGDPPWSADFLRLDEAHKWSRGDGVLVAVIDTGVNVSERVPAEPGGDYVVANGDGLSDCDAHGTLVASAIAGRPGPDDRVVGVAPGARLLSIRNTSKMFSAKATEVDPNDPNQSKPAGSVRTLARAIVHAANLGARVINISETACLKVADRVDQASLGAAVRYAVVDKDAVVVAAAGNTSDEGLGGSCAQNPGPVASDPGDRLGWKEVKTVVTPAWYAPLVLSVGATKRDGAAADFSMGGPWLGVAAPGVELVGLAPGPVDALPGKEGPVNLEGTSYSSAFVAGVAALVRAKFPGLTANQVMDRIVRTARHPGTGWNNIEGFGPVDAVAALTWDVPLGPQLPVVAVKKLDPPPPRVVADRGPVTWVVVVAGVLALASGGVWLGRKAVRSER
ncbi:type VII secretion-associated serine protease mycosin [Mycobacterium talmoniae]|uniref:Type VII secretion-associated serine protease mycosin n=1 Tax=Mycobacterium talmoniae TaxID=1858794 RepID=A0A1S1NHI7_9MYCO|nr:type VII secretion-associated serine protease mycosin [Mycobacterium talmoniae]OHV03541.1 type VII secretion-associated serine protease mycosin [Mycobacterium talmoniae]